MKNYILSILTILVFVSSSLFAQIPGAIDLTLNAGTAQNFTLRKTAIQSDGKIIIGGEFGGFNGYLQKFLIRLKPNGSIDSTFNIGKGPQGQINDIVIQPDGKILVTGGFSFFNNVTHRYIVRLNPDGSLDSSFNANAPQLTSFNCIALQLDGKILLGGDFFTYGGYSCRNIIRLKANGNIDSSFVTNNFLERVYSIVVQPDKKILVGSSTYDPTYPTNFVARLNEDGTEDVDFDRYQKLTQTLNQIALQPDGKVLVSGGGTLDKSSQLLIRLKSDGKLDSTFSLGASTKGRISAFSIDEVGKVVVSGDFLLGGHTKSICVARFNQNGSLDSSFQIMSYDNESWAITNSLQADGKIIVSGNFVQDGKSVYFFYRLNGGNATTAIEDDFQNTFKIYPNPVIDTISVSEYTEILDLTGKVVTNGVLAINLSHLPAGRYIAKQKNKLFHILKK